MSGKDVMGQHTVKNNDRQCWSLGGAHLGLASARRAASRVCDHFVQPDECAAGATRQHSLAPRHQPCSGQSQCFHRSLQQRVPKRICIGVSIVNRQHHEVPRLDYKPAATVWMSQKDICPLLLGVGDSKKTWTGVGHDHPQQRMNSPATTRSPCSLFQFQVIRCWGWVTMSDVP